MSEIVSEAMRARQALSVVPNYSSAKYAIRGRSEAIIGASPAMIELFEWVNRLAEIPATVLIQGETGTGKELVARALHYNGPRRDAPFIAINCAGIPETLLESMLFGHEKGSFTNAYRTEKGFVQSADGGTLFLDEIGEMSAIAQGKILRLLQEKEITPIGSDKPRKVDVRMVTGTNRNLRDEVARGAFRQDLYFRINVLPIDMPPLRERKSDIPFLVSYFIDRLNERYEGSVSGTSKDVIDRLKEGRYDGNVRELETIIERVFVVKREGIIDLSDLALIERFSRIAEPKAKPNQELLQTNDWFGSGVVPISAAELYRLRGTKSKPSILREIARNKVCVQPLGNQKVLFLTNESLPIVFANTYSDDYRVLRARLASDEFNSVARSPFQFYAASQLGPYLGRTQAACAKILQVAGAYSFETVSGLRLFALNANHARLLGKETSAAQPDVEALIAEINKGYAEFSSWQPNKA